MSTLEERIVDTTDDSERRDTFRMPKSEELRNAKLKVGRKMVNVQILDESAGGFLISGQRIPMTKPMDTVELFNVAGAHYLSVAWRRNVDGRTRLGLQRIPHAPPKPESPWLVWLVAAVVLGIGVGFVAATSKNPNALQRLLNGNRVVVNDTIPAADSQ